VQTGEFQLWHSVEQHIRPRLARASFLGTLQMTKPIANYSVGYGRPPEQHQFKAGRSGNPSGRPQGVRSFKSDLRDELAELVSVKHGNRTLELTRQRAVIKALVNAAVEGDLRAANTLLNLCAQTFGSDANSSIDDPEGNAADQEIVQASEERQRMRGGAMTNTNSSPKE
jgi:Family of unknown function (DUF5681)